MLGNSLLTSLFALLGRLCGETTLAYLFRGFAQVRRHGPQLRAWARVLHSGSLQGKTILVTGSARGLGRGIAAHLVAAGAKVVLPLRCATAGEAAVLRDRLAADATAIKKQFGNPLPPVLLARDVDVVSPACGLELGNFASIERFVDALKADGVVVDALINNAGMVPIAEGVTADGFERAFGINFLGTVHLTRLLEEKGVLHPTHGRIVNVSSEEHRLGSLEEHQPLTPASGTPLGALPAKASVFNAMDRYAYSKLLLTTYSHELRRRLASGKLVFDICPGPVASEIAREAPWPISSITQFGMKLIFPSPPEAALPVLSLAVQPLDVLPDAAAVHYHMSEPLAAGASADDAKVGAWLWKETMQLLDVSRKPPEWPARAA